MRKISENNIIGAVSCLCVEANISLPKDVYGALKRAHKAETNSRAKKILVQLLENADIAKREKIAICQDTGMPIVFVEVGKDIDISGVDITGAINKGVDRGYKFGFLRNSIVSDPLNRARGFVFSPAVIHFDFVNTKGLRITILPKGFGCENKTKLKMFNPTVEIAEIEDFVVGCVRDAGPDACPPYVIGVGIGGTADYACLLAKKALLRKVTSYKSHGTSKVKKIEQNLLKKINKLNIGPMGLGGKTTALSVHIETYPTHIAGLPVCVNISCHALRFASIVL